MKHHSDHPGQPRFVDGLVNPKIYHKPLTPKKKRLKFSRTWLIGVVGIFVLGFFLMPQVKSFTRQYEIFEALTNGRYLISFQNDTEIRPTGGFGGSFAIIESKNQQIKPLYFETNIYKLDTPFTDKTKIEPPKPLQAAIPDRGWALRDANFAADFRQSAPTMLWFFDQEARATTGERKANLDRTLGANYQLDGVVSVTLSSFLDVLELTGPITIDKYQLTVNKDNFLQIIQQYVEKDYFATETNKQANEPKAILQDLFPLALQKTQNLPKRQLYDLAVKLLNQKKIVVYTNDAAKESVLVNQGWAGALDLKEEQRTDRPTDYLGIVRANFGGNKSSLDINPIYRYTLSEKDNRLLAKAEITFEHTGTGNWPSGINHEYLRVLAPEGSELTAATRNGENATTEVDIGHEMDKQAFGFWMHTQPKSSQSFTLQYYLPKDISASNYQLALLRQPGGNNPDLTVSLKDQILFQARLAEDRVVKE